MRLAVYISHCVTLGHLTSVASILEGLRKHFENRLKVLILYSGERQRVINLERYGEVIYLPHPMGRKRSLFEGNGNIYNEILADDGMRLLLKKRLEIARNVIRKFKPAIFITEYYPFGGEFWSFELPYILKYIKENFETKVFSSVCGPGWRVDTLRILKEYYNGVFFHCTRNYYENYLNSLDKNNYTRKDLSKIIRDFPDKIYFTGYILNEKQLTNKEIIKERLGIRKKQKFIVVSRGGRTENPKIIIYSFRLAKLTSYIYLLISTGPNIAEKEFRKYKNLSKDLKNVKIVKFLPNFEDYLNTADLSINMAGYNTIVRLLWLRKQSIIIPLGNDEQKCRACYLEDFGIFRPLNYEVLSFKSLKRNVLDMLNNSLKPSHLIEGVDFDGIENTVRIIESLKYY